MKPPIGCLHGDGAATGGTTVKTHTDTKNMPLHKKPQAVTREDNGYLPEEKMANLDGAPAALGRR